MLFFILVSFYGTDDSFFILNCLNYLYACNLKIRLQLLDHYKIKIKVN